MTKNYLLLLNAEIKASSDVWDWFTWDSNM